MRGMATDRQEQKSVLYKYLLWAVVIVWEGSEGVGFDRCINFAIPLQPKGLGSGGMFSPSAGKICPQLPFTNGMYERKNPIFARA